MPSSVMALDMEVFKFENTTKWSPFSGVYSVNTAPPLLDSKHSSSITG